MNWADNSALQRLLAKSVDWFCDNVWPHIDSHSPTLSVQLDITNACNLRCDHCYLPHHRNHGALSFAQWVQVLEQFDKLRRTLRMQPSVTLCGGEPLSAPFLTDLLVTIRERLGNCDLSVQTNGTLLTERLVRSFRDLDVSIQISIDGPNADTHDRIRGIESFAKTLNGCQLLQRGAVPFFFQAVLSERTAPWIPQFFAHAKSSSATAMHFTRLVAEGHARTLIANGSDRPLVGNALKAALQEILQCSQRTNIPTSTFGPLWHLLDDKLGSPDNTGFASFVIDYRGGFKVSSRTPVVLGNVFTDGMDRIFLHHPIMQRLRSDEIEVCGECSHFAHCRGSRNSSFAAHGHFFGPDPACWLLSKQAQLALQQFHKEAI